MDTWYTSTTMNISLQIPNKEFFTFRKEKGWEQSYCASVEWGVGILRAGSRY
jgi:hypothetical protein